MKSMNACLNIDCLDGSSTVSNGERLWLFLQGPQIEDEELAVFSAQIYGSAFCSKSAASKRGFHID